MNSEFVEHVAAPVGTDAFHAAMAEALSVRINSARFRMWFQGRATFSQNDDCVIVGVPNLHIQEWLQSQFEAELQAAAAAVLMEPVTVRFRIDPALFRAGRAAQQVARETAAAEPIVPKPAQSPRTLFENVGEQPVKEPLPPRRRFRSLSDFVTGPGNRMAHASAMSVVETPGQDANPLVLHGPVGTGKTHLLEGVYIGLRRNQPDWRVLFVTSEDFTNRFVTSVRFGKQANFRKHFRHCDALLIDDVQFLAKKPATQLEFLHTLDTLLEAGKQVVMTADCHPRHNEQFSAELLDRLLGGAIWSLLPPDRDTRLRLLRHKVMPRPTKGVAATPALVSIPDAVLEHLADRLTGNVREIEGALNNLRHFSRVAGKPIDLAMAQEAMNEHLCHVTRILHIVDVDRAVCSVLHLPSGALQNRQRNWSISHARMIAIFLCRKHVSASFGEISSHFGGQSHSAAVAADKKVRGWLTENESIAAGGRQWLVRDLIERIERELAR